MSDPMSRLGLFLRRPLAKLAAAVAGPVIVLASVMAAYLGFGMFLVRLNHEVCEDTTLCGEDYVDADWEDRYAGYRLRRNLAGALVGVAVFVLIGGGLRSRGVFLEITAHWIRAGGREEPTAWLRAFHLGPFRTVLEGHDGRRWVLPAVPYARRSELEAVLGTVLAPTADALIDERRSAEVVRQALSAVTPASGR